MCHSSFFFLWNLPKWCWSYNNCTITNANLGHLNLIYLWDRSLGTKLFSLLFFLEIFNKHGPFRDTTTRLHILDCTSTFFRALSVCGQRITVSAQLYVLNLWEPSTFDHLQKKETIVKWLHSSVLLGGFSQDMNCQSSFHSQQNRSFQFTAQM